MSQWELTCVPARARGSRTIMRSAALSTGTSHRPRSTNEVVLVIYRHDVFAPSRAGTERGYGGAGLLLDTPEMSWWQQLLQLTATQSSLRKWPNGRNERALWLRNAGRHRGVEAPNLMTDAEPSPDAVIRTFGSKDRPRVKFFRDHAAWCPYCQRVWMVLEEKRIPYTVERINMRCYGSKPPAFLKKVPSGQLPVIEVDGKVVTESYDIIMMLEHRFPENPLLPPAGSRLREAAGALLQLERDLFALWCRWLFQPNDWGGEEHAERLFVQAIGSVDESLDRIGGSGPFFLGEEISLVDLVFAPFMERYCASLMYWKGFKLRNSRWPAIDRWMDALEARPSYAGTQSDWYTHCHDIPPQYGLPYPNNASKDIAAAIDGRDGRSWRLPLPPLNATSLEPRTNSMEDGDAPMYRLRAASKLVGNHAAVVQFALRGVGSRGAKMVAAPLADPSAKPGTEAEKEVDAALRLVAHALVVGHERIEMDEEVMEEWLGYGEDGRDAADRAEAVAACLGYLRDRVGVPRDLQLPAARQLRAYLNWVSDKALAYAQEE